MSAPKVIQPSKPFYPQIEHTVDRVIARHLGNIYTALNNHDQAIVKVNTKVTSATSTAASATTAAAAASSSSSSGGGSSTNNFPGLGSVNDQTGVTSYMLQQTDNGALIIIDDAAPVAVSLNSVITGPFLCFITNLGAGLGTLTPTSGTVNGAASFPLPQNYITIVIFSGGEWWASALPVVPQNTSLVAHQFFTAYNAATGVFSAAQPDFTDISGNLATGQLPTAGLSVTITTAQLTSLGTQGSMTFTNGVLTAQTPAT